MWIFTSFKKFMQWYGWTYIYFTDIVPLVSNICDYNAAQLIIEPHLTTT